MSIALKETCKAQNTPYGVDYKRFAVNTLCRSWSSAVETTKAIHYGDVTMTPRYLDRRVREDLAEKMVFIGGPRQVGRRQLCFMFSP